MASKMGRHRRGRPDGEWLFTVCKKVFIDYLTVTGRRRFSLTQIPGSVTFCDSISDGR